MGQKFFFWRIQLCHAQFHMGFYNHAKIWKKLMIQFQENAWTDGRMEGQKDGRVETNRPYLIWPYWPPPGVPLSGCCEFTFLINIFFKKVTSPWYLEHFAIFTKLPFTVIATYFQHKNLHLIIWLEATLMLRSNGNNQWNKNWVSEPGLW